MQDVDDPILKFKSWYEEAQTHEKDPAAMVLSTLGENDQPYSRVVLLKEVSVEGFLFFTNYQSKKSQQLLLHAKAALNFYWPFVYRQVCVIGKVKPISRKESENYFKKRPYGSQISAWVSPQSQIIESRQKLLALHTEFQKKFPEGKVPCPEGWGGFRLVPSQIEFWAGFRNRLHERIRYTKKNNNWLKDYLAP